MPGGIDTATGMLTIPIWAAGVACAVFLVALVVAIGRVGATAFIATLFRVAVVLVAVIAGYFYLQNRSEQEHTAARRSLDERSAALMARAIAPGSALSCLDELAGETVEVACERAVFASPEAIAAAVSYVTAKLALLADGNEHAQHVDPAFATELAPLRTALEQDRFGIVAHVLTQREGCTVEHCESLARLNETSHVIVNLREHTFDDEVAKYMAVWNQPARPSPPDEPAVATIAPAAPANPTPGPAAVAPKYDFPSSQSIPPVSIMAPEPALPRQAVAPPQAAATAPPVADAPVTPVPPRRPPQVRSTQANVPARSPAARTEPPSADTLGPR